MIVFEKEIMILNKIRKQAVFSWEFRYSRENTACCKCKKGSYPSNSFTLADMARSEERRVGKECM